MKIYKDKSDFKKRIDIVLEAMETNNISFEIYGDKIIRDEDYGWLFKIQLDDKFDFEDTSDENVGKMSKYLETKILSIANSNHAAITESIKEELTETARSFNFIHFLSDKSYEEREEYDMADAELFGRIQLLPK